MELLHVINRKWTILTIVAIGNHSGVRFNQLKGELNGISSKTLSETMRELEKSGVTKSQITITDSLITEYFLTENGKELREAMLPAVKWIYEKSGKCRSRAVCMALGVNKGDNNCQRDPDSRPDE